ncbi:hypothetical protein GCM10010182_70810 [Actinomadura cremea]|nr:hypothetical protein GCM10010182_70810 [Actinomadura cremea]
MELAGRSYRARRSGYRLRLISSAIHVRMAFGGGLGGLAQERFAQGNITRRPSVLGRGLGLERFV